MNRKYVPCQKMTTDEKELYLIASQLTNNKAELQKFYSQFIQEISKLPLILEKRIEVFKLPKVEICGLIALTLLGQNPAACLIGLIETLEIAKELNPIQIDIIFISQNVYPLGFYSKQQWMELFDFRQANRQESYNYIL